MTTRARATAAAKAADTSADAPAVREPVEPVPRWAVRVAHAIPLCVLPSGLWRVALVLGLAGHDADYHWAVWERPYVIGLSVVSEGLALLALGLVRPWGEVVPRWAPGLRGRQIPIPAVVIPAALGATLIMMLCAYGVLNQIFGFVEPMNENGDGFPTSGPAAWALWATYAPLLAWGPLLAILTVAYYRRRRARDAPAAAARPEAVRACAGTASGPCGPDPCGAPAWPGHASERRSPADSAC